MYIMSIMLTVLLILIGVAFRTLMDWKVLSYIQIRKDPNKVGMLGFLQPITDAIKLFFKEHTILLMSNYIIYVISPIIRLFNSLLILSIYPFLINYVSFNFGLLFFFCCASLGVYSMMITGWSSNSNYALMGCIRSIVQSNSYEVSLILILLCPALMVESFNVIDLFMFKM